VTYILTAIFVVTLVFLLAAVGVKLFGIKLNGDKAPEILRGSLLPIKPDKPDKSHLSN
jgi:uncharacterized membrane protein